MLRLCLEGMRGRAMRRGHFHASQPRCTLPSLAYVFLAGSLLAFFVPESSTVVPVWVFKFYQTSLQREYYFRENYENLSSKVADTLVEIASRILRKFEREILTSFSENSCFIKLNSTTSQGSSAFVLSAEMKVAPCKMIRWVRFMVQNALRVHWSSQLANKSVNPRQLSKTLVSRLKKLQWVSRPGAIDSMLQIICT